MSSVGIQTTAETFKYAYSWSDNNKSQMLFQVKTLNSNSFTVIKKHLEEIVTINY
jgi:hypothetical protein